MNQMNCKTPLESFSGNDKADYTDTDDPPDTIRMKECELQAIWDQLAEDTSNYPIG